MPTRPYAPRRSTAFTLVELLVVIGIIALLMSILLPALGRARAQANAVKCATQLREIGNAFRYYANDNRAYYPPSKLEPIAAAKYQIDGYDFANGKAEAAYWTNFLNRYVTKVKAGNAGENAAAANDLKNRSVLWGCPNFDAYTNGLNAAKGFTFNVLQTGYGMNDAPGYTQTSKGNAPASALAVPWDPAKPGKGFVKSSVWGKNGSERMLATDALYFQAYSNEPTYLPRGGGIASFVGPQNGDAANSVTDPLSSVSFWRHGKLPASESTGTPSYNVSKGRVSVNILYCDGHVVTSNDFKDGFKSYRMKFPG